MNKKTTESIIEIMQSVPAGFKIPKRSKDRTERFPNLFEDSAIDIPDKKKKISKTNRYKKSK